MLSDAAMSSKKTDWGKEDRQKCKKCGAELQKRGKQKRRMQTWGGKEVELERDYGVCPKCGEVFFPLDDELELLPGGLTPHGHESLIRLSGWVPFERSVELYADMTGIVVSDSMSRRYTLAARGAYEKLQNEEADYLEKVKPAAPQRAEKLQISVDGAMVPLIHGEWKEVRTLVIGEVEPAVKEKGEWVVHTRNPSYFSRKVTSQEFERLSLVEVQRRGVENAKEVAAVMDGAEWLQSFIDYHCPDAIRILDFPHASEHISPIGQYLFGEGTPETREWLNERFHKLKHQGPEKMMDEFQELHEKYPDAEVITGNLAYLEKRTAQMKYPEFQAQGWPIGSGIVESANKLVVEARLKGSGMHWAQDSVNPMLAIRNILCSDRWKEEWPKIAVHLRTQAADRRSNLHLSKKSVPDMLPEPLPLPRNPTQTFSAAREHQPHSPKPTDNPWRKFKFGKALYQRSDTAKK